jgi:tetratricopeptide (TPR) repeat protein
LYPGAIDALSEAISADPQFALAHVAKARALQLHGDFPGAMASLAVARDLTPGLTAREASQVSVFVAVFSNPQSPVAVESVLAHLGQWPRDALVLSTCASQIGLIGLSGLTGREQRLANLLDGLAGAYGDDWWFLAHHGMALSEVGRRDEGRPKIERSRAQRAENALMAHAQAHICYEDGEPEAAVAFMRNWLRDYPRRSLLYGHLSWHLALVWSRRVVTLL